MFGAFSDIQLSSVEIKICQGEKTSSVVVVVVDNFY